MESESSWRPLHDEAELTAWAAQRRRDLVDRVHLVSPLGRALLEGARATPRRLLALSERQIRCGDWRSRFLGPCTVVVRDMLHPLGRLGAWEEGGVLCVEAALSDEAALTLRGRRGVVALRGGLPETLLIALEGLPAYRTLRHPLLANVPAAVEAVSYDAIRDLTEVTFATTLEPFSLAA